MNVLANGTFVLVKTVSANRAGKDGMVVDDFGDGRVALVFGFDRNNKPQGCACVGRELWNLSELNLNSETNQQKTQ